MKRNFNYFQLFAVIFSVWLTCGIVSPGVIQAKGQQTVYQQHG